MRILYFPLEKKSVYTLYLWCLESFGGLQAQTVAPTSTPQRLRPRRHPQGGLRDLCWGRCPRRFNAVKAPRWREGGSLPHVGFPVGAAPKWGREECNCLEISLAEFRIISEFNNTTYLVKTNVRSILIYILVASEINASSMLV